MSLFNGNLENDVFPFPKEIADANVVDLISMDIENLEFEVLENFPFYKYYIKVFILEANTHEAGGKLDILMTTNSYIKIASIGKDGIYIHKKFASEMMKLHFMDSDNIPNVLEDLQFPDVIAVDPYKEPFKFFMRRFLDSAFQARE